MKHQNIQMFIKINFLQTLADVFLLGYEPMDIPEIFSEYSSSFPFVTPGHYLGSCSGIAYYDDKLKIVPKNELLEFLKVNYSINSLVETREELRITDQSLLATRDVVLCGCFRIVPEVFRALRGTEYEKKYAEEHGFEEEKTHRITPEQILDNLILLDMVNGDRTILDNIASSVGTGLTISQIRNRGSNNPENSRCIRTWLLYPFDCEQKGSRVTINDFGLETYDFDIPLLGKKVK